MTIRELADTIHTSPTTVVRLATKLGFKGWAELKYYIKSSENENFKIDEDYEPIFSLDLFWKQLTRPEIQEKLNHAVDLIAKAKYTVFLGLGTSAALCQYGARYFNNLSLSAYTFNDIFRPISVNEFADVVVIVLSVSGETSEIVAKSIALKHAGASLITITNNSQSTLSKLSDINLSYNIPDKFATPVNNDIKLTTQLPVLALLELLAYRAHQISSGTLIS